MCIDEEPAVGREPQQHGGDGGRGGAAHHAHAHRQPQRHAQRPREQERFPQCEYQLAMPLRIYIRNKHNHQLHCTTFRNKLEAFVTFHCNKILILIKNIDKTLTHLCEYSTE